MKRFLFWFFTFIQILLFTGIFVLEKLFLKYMTIMRVVLYKNRTWEAELPVPNLLFGAKFFLIAIGFLALTFLIIRFVKKQAFHLHGQLELLTLAVISGGSALFIISSGVDAMPTYYFSTTILLVITAIQLIKVLLFLKRNNSYI